MFDWTSVFLMSLICHGGYLKLQAQNKGVPEPRRIELTDRSEQEPGHVTEGLEFLGKSHVTGNAYI